MFKDVSAFAVINDQTGYGIHATNFFGELNKILPVKLNRSGGEVSISLIDSFTAQTYCAPKKPSILYNVWESTRQSGKFIDNLKNFDQLWVASEWQRQCTIEQGVNPDFVKVVPEGINSNIYKPTFAVYDKPTFDFLIVGKWEDRKYTREMIAAWLEVFDNMPNVRLYVAADNPFAFDGMGSTEERLEHYALTDPRIIPVHFESKEDHLRRLQTADVYLSCSRAEGWNLPLIEAMACGIPSIALDYSGSTEFAKDALLVKIKNMIKPINVNGFPDCPGEWAGPDFNDLKRVIRDAYDNYRQHKEKALETSVDIRKNFSWKKAARKAYDLLCALNSQIEITKKETKKENNQKDIFVVGCWPSSQERMDTLVETIRQIKDMGYPILLSSHYPVPPAVLELVDYYLYEKENILSGDNFKPIYSRVNQEGKVEQKESNIKRHDVACLSAIRNAIDFCKGKYDRLHYMEFDVEVDLEDWVSKVTSVNTPLVFIEYEKRGVRTDIFAGGLNALDMAFPRISSWKEYIEARHGYVLEFWIKDHMQELGLFLNDISIVPCDISNRFDQVDREIWSNDVFSLHFVEGPFLNISGLSRRVYDVSFTDQKTGDCFKLQQRCGEWSRPDAKYYRDWEVVVRLNGEEKYRAKLGLKGQRVLISLGSKALGDTLAWMPFVEEFRKKHQCHVIASTWWNSIFDYPEIEFVEPGSKVENLRASYEVGCYDGDLTRNPRDWRTLSLQEIASDILGLEYQEIRPRLKIPEVTKNNKYVCFSEHSTMKAKLWNRPGAWQEVVNYLCEKGLGVMSISKEPSNLLHITRANGKTIQETIAALAGCEFYIGLGHGPSWLAWALGVPVIMISGFSDPFAEFPTPYRVINKDVCHGCFNDVSVKFGRGWEWCPKNKNYECTREITPEMVIEQINKRI